ncbi:UDP-N-acetylmuramate--L-alanine ligase [Salegentibacter sp. HM20]
MNFHFIAIGGSAMHSLAIALQNQGHRVSGSDDVIYEPAKSALQNAGLLPEAEGWFPEKINTPLDAVILGMHAKADNPELLKAQADGLKIYSYPEFLFEQSRDKTRVVIAGSHGKTTITAMILHVMNYHEKDIDYMLGASIEGIAHSVQLSPDNDFILIEGDEYPSSAIDKRPKFLHYQPNIALVSGIAWDHINIFKTKQDYAEQFSLFVNSLVNGGILVYNEEDTQLKSIVETSENPVRKHPYSTPNYHLENGQCILDTPEGELPLEIFGKHNMNNLAGAKWICQHMGIDEDDFYEAIAGFKGASKRLQKIAENESAVIFRDFAHSPSKVNASVAAVKELHPGRKLIACLELHTFSSLNSDFLSEYKNSLNPADEAIVFYSKQALLQKGRPDIPAETIKDAFGKKDLKVFTEAKELKGFLQNLGLSNAALLMMSSGEFGGFKPEEIKGLIH